MTSPCSGLIYGSLRALWGLRLNQGPLGDVGKQFPVKMFRVNFTAVQIVENDVSVALTPENVDFVVDQDTRVGISTLGDLTLRDTFVPSEFLRGRFVC